MTDPLLPDVPDDAARLARAKVEELRARADTLYNRLCLQGWEQELARLQDAESGTVQSPVKHTKGKRR